MTKQDMSVTAKFISGGVAVLMGVTCVFPIDLAKTRLQNQHGKISTRGLNCLMKMAKVEGFLGMYRGAAVTLTLVTPEKAIKLAGNDFFWQLLMEDGYGQVLDGVPQAAAESEDGDDSWMWSWNVPGGSYLSHGTAQDSAAGCWSFGAYAIGSACKASTHKRPSATLIVWELLHTRGLPGLYQGLGATLLRDIPFSIICFPLFANLNSLRFNELTGKASFAHSFLSGCVAGSTAAVTVTPLDVVKVQIQTLKKGLGEDSYSGITDCARKLRIQEGPSAFVKGAGCRALVTAPLFGIAQGVYFIGIGERILKCVE